jgi:DNA-binding IscR family transcriptional regulator
MEIAMMVYLDKKSIAAHIIVALAHAQEHGRVLRLDELASEVGVRKGDVREVVTRLHREGHVDALRLRVTMTGLALAASLSNRTLRATRRRPLRLVLVA